MSKKPTQIAEAINFTPINFKDAAYKSALAGESLESVARWVNDKCPTFLDEVPAEIKSELRDGFALRWQEKHPAQGYNSNGWIPAENGDTLMTLAYCLSYSQQAFGQLKRDQPVLHGIIGPIRTKFNQFVSNKMSDLERAIRKIQAEGKPAKTRDQAKAFAEYLSDTFASMAKRCETSRNRGDMTVPDKVQLRVAIEAFHKALK